MKDFLRELKRRSVIRVAIVYGALAFALLQIADLAVEPLRLPEWSMSLLWFLVLGGYPVALVLAWAFDLTPEGVRRAGSGGAARKKAVRTLRASWLPGRTLAVAGVLLAVGGTGWFFGRSAGPERTDPAARPGPTSLAVLPFVNMSGDPANEYFSDGLSEELLNVLARSRDLRVAARTSSFAYKGRTIDVRDVGRELGVEYVLEGSVRRDGDRVRVTAQLIESDDGFHLWSETYDRHLSDIFAIQDDISGRIASELRVALRSDDSSGGEVLTGAETRPTDDLEAYQLFLRGRHLFHQRTEESVLLSIELLEAAVERDPDFAEAWSALASAYYVVEGYATVAYDWAGRAERTARRAIALDSALAEPRAVLGGVLGYRASWREATEMSDLARSLAPRDPVVLLWSASLRLELGQIDQARALLEETVALDPASGVVRGWLGHALRMLGEEDAALEAYRTALEHGWGGAGPRLCQAVLHFRRMSEARECAEGLSDRDEERTSSWLLLRADSLADALGDPARREATLTLLRGYPNRWSTREILFLAGEHDVALETLRDDFATGSVATWQAMGMWGRPAAGMRRLPGFAAFVEEIGMVDHWRETSWPAACTEGAGGTVVCR